MNFEKELNELISQYKNDEANIKDITTFIEDCLGYCDKCGCCYNALPVYKKDNKELIGFNLLCDCNCDGETVSMEEIGMTKIYRPIEIVYMFNEKRKK